jgi:hypothetical protein
LAHCSKVIPSVNAALCGLGSAMLDGIDASRDELSTALCGVARRSQCDVAARPEPGVAPLALDREACRTSVPAVRRVVDFASVVNGAQVGDKVLDIFVNVTEQCRERARDVSQEVLARRDAEAASRAD